MSRAITCFVFLVPLPAAVGAPPAPPPQAAHILVLDTSGSMSTLDGKKTRLERSIDEGLALARAYPPSPTAPFVVVTFTDVASAPRTFQDTPAIEKFFRDELKAGGGTSIAKGLAEGEAALAALKNAPRVVFVLITDGEDMDTLGIEAVQSRLVSVLKHRKDAHAANSNTVLVRAWSQSVTDAIAEPFRQSGAADVIDLATAKRFPVTVAAAVRPVGAAWVDPGKSVRLTFASEAKATGNRAPLQTEVDLICDRAPAIRVAAGAAPRTDEVVLPVSAGEVAAGSVDLGFLVCIGGLESCPGGAHELSAAPANLKATFPLPQLAVQVRFTLTAVGTARWVKLATDRAEQEYALTWTVTPTGLVRPFECEIVSRTAGFTVVRGGKVRIDGDGGTVPLVVGGSVPSGARREVAFSVALPSGLPLSIAADAPASALTGPPPVLVRTAPASGPYRAVIEGKVGGGAREFTPAQLRPVAVDPLPDGAADGLTFELTGDPGVKPSEARPAVGAAVPAWLAFPGPARLWTGDRLTASAEFAPVGAPTSVRAEPIKFVIVRESRATLLVGVLLGVVALAVVGYAVATRFRPVRPGASALGAGR